MPLASHLTQNKSQSPALPSGPWTCQQLWPHPLPGCWPSLGWPSATPCVCCPAGGSPCLLCLRASHPPSDVPSLYPSLALFFSTAPVPFGTLSIWLFICLSPRLEYKFQDSRYAINTWVRNDWENVSCHYYFIKRHAWMGLGLKLNTA